MKYAFSFHEVRKPDRDRLHFDTLDLVEVDTSRFTIHELKTQLRPWALHILRNGDFELGLYCAEFTTLDQHGQPDKHISDDYIAWAGSREHHCPEQAPAVLTNP